MSSKLVNVKRIEVNQKSKAAQYINNVSEVCSFYFIIEIDWFMFAIFSKRFIFFNL